ncbi:X-ray radiation resistance-associated protein 1, partial [Physocladia obscura]
MEAKSQPFGGRLPPLPSSAPTPSPLQASKTKNARAVAIKTREYLLGKRDGRAQTPAAVEEEGEEGNGRRLRRPGGGEFEGKTGEDYDVDYDDNDNEENCTISTNENLTRQERMRKIRTRLHRGRLVPHVLDGVLMLSKCKVKDPVDVFVLDVSNKSLRFVIPEDLALFENLHTLWATENMLPFAKLGSLLNLRRLGLAFNEISDLDLEVDGLFLMLEQLDLSYNHVTSAALIVLATLPALKSLDLTANQIREIPIQIANDMEQWREKVIELLLPNHVALLDAAFFGGSGTVATVAVTGMPIDSNAVVHPAMEKILQVVSDVQSGLDIPLANINKSDYDPQLHTISRTNETGDGVDDVRNLLQDVSGKYNNDGDEIIRDDEEIVEMAVHGVDVEVNMIARANLNSQLDLLQSTIHETFEKSKQIAIVQSDKTNLVEQEKSVVFAIDNNNNGVITNIPQLNLSPGFISRDGLVGFGALECLVLEQNCLSSELSFRILGKLPNLKKLNLNNNKFRDFFFLSEEPDGFLKLEELRIAFNKVETMKGLFGIIWLPALKYVWIEGNPAMKEFSLGNKNEISSGYTTLNVNAKVDDAILSYSECDPLKILPGVYGIQVQDLIYQPHPSVLEDSYYALRPIQYNPNNSNFNLLPGATATGGVVLRRIIRPHPPPPPEWSQFSSAELPKTHQRSRLAHQVIITVIDGAVANAAHPDENQLRRRDYKLTDQEVKETVRAGRVLTLKELKRIRRNKEQRKQRENGGFNQESRQQNEDTQREMIQQGLEEERKKLHAVLSEKNQNFASEENKIPLSEYGAQFLQQKVEEASGINYAPEIQDKTFITGVHITGGNLQISPKRQEKETVQPMSGTSNNQDQTENQSNNEVDQNFDEKFQEQSNCTDEITTISQSQNKHAYPFQLHPHFPKSIQASIRALRHALANPISYWRVVEDSYAKPTFSYSVRVRDMAATRNAMAAAALATSRNESKCTGDTESAIGVDDSASVAGGFDEYDGAGYDDIGGGGGGTGQGDGAKPTIAAATAAKRSRNRRSRVTAALSSAAGGSETSSNADANVMPASGNISPANSMWTTVAVKVQAEQEAAIAAAARAAKNIVATAKICN